MTDLAGPRGARTTSLFFRPKADGAVWLDFAIYAAWAAIVLFQVVHHVMWRDEVRALSIALAGDGFPGMLRVLHGELHPALWYLLLRGAHDVFGTVAVLPGVAFAVAAGAAALLVFASPFPRALVVLLVFGHALVFEYSVMARNYGISALLLFAIAALYPRWRDRGLLLGVLLFLLANTNVVAMMMAAAFLLFWLLDILEETGLRWTPKLGNFILNAAIAFVGAVVCAATMLPTYNDAAALDLSNVSLPVAALKALLNPGGRSPSALVFLPVPSRIISILLYGATIGLMRRRAAFLAALAGLAAFSLFSVFASMGSRHALVWFSFLVALYWIAWRDVFAPPSAAGRTPLDYACAAGRFLFLLLVGVQLLQGVQDVRFAWRGPPDSRSADLGRLLQSRPDLGNAIVVADPEYMIEALPYYAANPTYFVREQRFGNVTHFSKSGKLDTDLGETLSVSRALQKTSGAPVVIVLAHRLAQMKPGTYPEGYNWSFSASEAQIREFLAATTPLAQFGPARSDESYDVYLLRDPAGPPAAGAVREN